VTPLGRILKRIVGKDDDRTEKESSTAATRAAIADRGGRRDAVADGAPAEQGEGEQKRRRRGRRGGRGRRKGGAGEAAANGAEAGGNLPAATQSAAQQTPSKQPTARQSTAEQPAAEPRESRGERSRGRDGRSGGGQRRGRGPVRGLGDRRGSRERRLEEPLPEDVAFRPAAAGGDDSLLPGRRRRPPGPRTTNRVILVGGRRYLPSVEASRTEPLPPPEPAAVEERAEPHEAPPARHDESGAVIEEDGAPRKRRRGRRGGRRHRRHEDAATTLDGQATSVEEGAEAVAGEAERSAAAPEQAQRAEPVEAPPAEVTPSREPAAAPRERVEEPAARVDRRRSAQPAERETAARAPAPEAEAAPEAEPRERHVPAARERRPAAELPAAFAALGVGEVCLQTLAEMGFEDPTPIQERTIPALLAGRDVVGVAQTGSGKTLAFGLPLAESVDVTRREVQAIVLVPTRELAQQVLGVLQEVAEPHRLNVIGLLGGRALAGDFRALEGRPHIVVGTPGRILDHLRRGTLELRGVRYAVLDEADEMLDIGFLPDITRILSRTPRRRQTSLFSATMPHAVMRLVRRYMQDPETVSVVAEHDTVETIDQFYVEVAHRDKLRGLRELVERELKGRTLVFSRTRRGVDYVADRLRDMGVRAGALHGDMDQRRRDQVVRRFREGDLDLLVATNVAARGLDIPEITHVVNFDVPQNAEEYVHRIGRTGRAGRHGTAITFVSEHDIGEFDILLAAFGDRLRQERLELYDPA
jgi:superfamily II DNA/RNA helicase